MNAAQKLTDRESIAINIIKAISVLSVIAAHTVYLSDTNIFINIVSSFWKLFGEVGVIIFFVLGGFLYSRTPHDDKPFWKKKFFRIVLPWIVCSSITYLISSVLTHHFSMVKYFKWIFGSESLYYYIVIYTFFLFIFKWLYNKDVILYSLIGLQILSLTLTSCGLSTTIPLDIFTDFLNPLHWIGYFSFGILIRKYRWDLIIRKQKFFVFGAYVLTIISGIVLFAQQVFTYFHIISCFFCLSALVVVTDFAFKFSNLKSAKHIAKIGMGSYCIYLLHIQIVQSVVCRVPSEVIRVLFSPWIGLGVMIALISAGLLLCKKLPFGTKIKTLVGL